MRHEICRSWTHLNRLGFEEDVSNNRQECPHATIISHPFNRDVAIQHGFKLRLQLGRISILGSVRDVAEREVSGGAASP